MARDILDDEHLRIRLLLVGMLAMFGFLAMMLWHIQVVEGGQYEKDELRQSVRRVRLPGLRGRIMDRTGLVLADNRPAYSIVIYLEEVRQPGPWSRTIDHIEKMLDELSAELGVERTLTRRDIQTHRERRLPLPLVAWSDVDDRVLARWAERVSGMPGVDIQADAQREYPEGPLAAHLLGYVGRADPVPDAAEPYHYYIPEMQGKSGLERRLDEALRGEAGGRLVRIDVSGYRHKDMALREPLTGQDVQLTLDARIQRLAEDALGESPGAVVVLDPRNGDVLAMASKPGYDPNDFIPGISTALWRKLLNDEDRPLINRAVAGAYAPGSIFKPIVDIAALENKLAGPDTVFDCPGYFELGRARFHCWARHGHGSINMRQSLERSCNVYYFRLALQIGYDAIYHMASAMGLGRRTGIPVDFEVDGLLPDNAWKKRVQGDAWRDGDTCNVSIGQGPITVTPMQMAVVAATLANGGTVYTPHLIAAMRSRDSEEMVVQPRVPGHSLNWSRTTLQTVRGGMRDVIYGDYGTARAAAIPGIEYAGKTGTAEFGVKEEGKKHAWTMAFAPFDQPRYAVALMVDEGLSGGMTAAPKVKKLIEQLLLRDGDITEEGAP